jgi:hypothetical protein
MNWMERKKKKRYRRAMEAPRRMFKGEKIPNK